MYNPQIDGVDSGTANNSASNLPETIADLSHSDLSSVSFELDASDAHDVVPAQGHAVSIQATIDQAKQYMEPVLEEYGHGRSESVRAAPEGLLAGLPQQYQRHKTREPFNFNIMVAGRSGLGKTTFLNMLFPGAMTDARRYHFPGKTAGLNVTYIELEENSVKGNFTLIDTPGFGNGINNTNCSISLTNYIDKQLMRYMFQEEQPDRSKKQDARVNVCLYFIEPNGRPLCEIDKQALKELGIRVNLIPIIAKSDSMTPHELTQFKQDLCQEMARNKVRVYHDLPPYSLICSANTAILDGRECFARINAYGVINCEDSRHCEFNLLRKLLFYESTLELIDSTHRFYYYYQRMILMLYRSKKLNLPGQIGEPNNSFTHPLSFTPLNCGKTNLDALRGIQPIGFHDLEKEHLENDPLFLQQVRTIQVKYNMVGLHQSQRFSKIQQGLVATRQKSEQELKQVHYDIKELQDRIDVLRIAGRKIK